MPKRREREWWRKHSPPPLDTMTGRKVQAVKYCHSKHSFAFKARNSPRGIYDLWAKQPLTAGFNIEGEGEWGGRRIGGWTGGTGRKGGGRKRESERERHLVENEKALGGWRRSYCCKSQISYSSKPCSTHIFPLLGNQRRELVKTILKQSTKTGTTAKTVDTFKKGLQVPWRCPSAA